MQTFCLHSQLQDGLLYEKTIREEDEKTNMHDWVALNWVKMTQSCNAYALSLT